MDTRKKRIPTEALPQYNTPQCRCNASMQCSAVQCRCNASMQPSAVQCSADATPQCSTVQCSAVQMQRLNAVQCSAVQCSAVQCRCDASMQCSAAQCKCNASMQHSAVPYNTTRCSEVLHCRIAFISFSEQTDLYDRVRRSLKCLKIRTDQTVFYKLGDGESGGGGQVSVHVGLTRQTRGHFNSYYVTF
jgi:hypothetical protein